MIFKPELVSLICQAIKTQTRRRTTMNPNSPWYEGGCRYKVGGEYAVQPGRSKHGVATIRVTRVEKQRLGTITPADARAEGFQTVEQFADYWRRMHGAFPEACDVWMLEFTLIERAEFDRQHEDDVAAAEIEQDLKEHAELDAKLRARPHESRYDG